MYEREEGGKTQKGRKGGRVEGRNENESKKSEAERKEKGKIMTDKREDGRSEEVRKNKARTNGKCRQLQVTGFHYTAIMFNI
jgi:hypothetical protein